MKLVIAFILLTFSVCNGQIEEVPVPPPEDAVVDPQPVPAIVEASIEKEIVDALPVSIVDPKSEVDSDVPPPSEEEVSVKEDVVDSPPVPAIIEPPSEEEDDIPPPIPSEEEVSVIEDAPEDFEAKLERIGETPIVDDGGKPTLLGGTPPEETEDTDPKPSLLGGTLPKEGDISEPAAGEESKPILPIGPPTDDKPELSIEPRPVDQKPPVLENGRDEILELPSEPVQIELRPANPGDTSSDIGERMRQLYERLSNENRDDSGTGNLVFLATGPKDGLGAGIPIALAAAPQESPPRQQPTMQEEFAGPSMTVSDCPSTFNSPCIKTRMKAWMCQINKYRTAMMSWKTEIEIWWSGCGQLTDSEDEKEWRESFKCQQMPIKCKNGEGMKKCSGGAMECQICECADNEYENNLTDIMNLWRSEVAMYHKRFQLYKKARQVCGGGLSKSNGCMDGEKEKTRQDRNDRRETPGGGDWRE
ncbi:uncharacterized protein LOC120344898 isoform X3 [Styela clava]